MQGKCDSVNYVLSDSTLYMRGEPVLWAEDTQMSGDSINIMFSNKKIDRLMLRPNAFVIQQDSIKGFNQIKGKQITTYFKGNEVDHLFNEGNAETIYWLRDDDGSLIGVNFSQSTTMDINIIDKQISNIKFYQSIKETLYPEEQLKEEQEYLI